MSAAISYNSARYTRRSIRLMQDIVGAEPTGVMDADTVHMLVEWQADFRLDEDGKIGLRTLRTIAREMISERARNTVINLIIDGHNLSRNGLASIRYNRALTDSEVAALAAGHPMDQGQGRLLHDVVLLQQGSDLIDPRAVRANIERMHAENPKGSVVIQANKASTNKMLVWVMDSSRSAGVYNISIADQG